MGRAAGGTVDTAASGTAAGASAGAGEASVPVGDPLGEFLSSLPPIGEEYSEGDRPDEGEEDAPAPSPKPGEESQTPEAKPEETPEVKPTADEETAAYAEYGKQWEDGISKAPAETVTSLIAALDKEIPGFAQQIAAQITGQPAATGQPGQQPGESPLPADFEPFDELSAMLMPLAGHVDTLTRLPEVVSERVKSAFDDFMPRLAPHLDAPNVEAQILQHQVAALAEALGIELPGVDRAAVNAALKADLKLSYEDAVKKVVGDSFKTTVTRHKQAVKERPSTPGGNSEGFAMPEAGPDGVVDARAIYKQLFG